MLSCCRTYIKVLTGININSIFQENFKLIIMEKETGPYTIKSTDKIGAILEKFSFSELLDYCEKLYSIRGENIAAIKAAEYAKDFRDLLY